MESQGKLEESGGKVRDFCVRNVEDTLNIGLKVSVFARNIYKKSSFGFIRSYV